MGILVSRQLREPLPRLLKVEMATDPISTTVKYTKDLFNIVTVSYRRVLR